MPADDQASLPAGYRVEEDGRYLCVMDPAGELVWVEPRGLAASVVVEARAWWDTLRQRLEAVGEGRAEHEAAAALAAGERLLEDVHRLAAAVESPVESRERPARMRWPMCAAATAAAVIGLVAAPAAVMRDRHPLPVATIGVRRPAAAAPVAAQTAVKLPIRRSASHRRFASALTPRGGARAASPAPPGSVATRYAVRFGEFSDPEAAAGLMHAVRAKGYLAYVLPHAGQLQVMTRPYPTRRQAAAVVETLSGIGLPGRIVAARVR